MDPLRQDQAGEHLRQQNASLRFAFETIDRDIARAAARYLSNVTDRRYLKFKDFLDLLVLEIRRQAIDELKAANLKKVASEEFQRKLEERIEGLMPTIEGRLSDYITLQVLVTHGAKKFNPKSGRVELIMPMARPVRGSFQAGHGQNPEAAYNAMRERLVLDLFEVGSDSILAAQLKRKDDPLSSLFAEAKPYRVEEIGGFTVEARIADPRGSLERTA